MKDLMMMEEALVDDYWLEEDYTMEYEDVLTGETMDTTEVNEMKTKNLAFANKMK